MADWESVVGLEIHVHLKTRTKMFCRCELEYFAEPNTRTCPVCLAHPGSLPVANRKAVEWTIKLGLALGCEIADEAVFSRKNYFYPDNPKGYQISQYDQPLCIGGSLLVPGADGDREVGFVRAHLEEDAAKTVHVGGGTGRKVGSAYSLIDFNRAGTPLVEIVTQPDIRSADEAVRFLRLLRQTIVELGISDAEMEKGTLRVDANVSVRQPGEEFRTRWELKNMNSFTFIGRGIEAAAREQIRLYESGASVNQQTYDYEPDSDRLTPHRTKEEADDYRYFPEPDLVPVQPEAETIERLRAELPELPGTRLHRIEKDFGVPREDALPINALPLVRLLEKLTKNNIEGARAAKFLLNDLPDGVAPELFRVEDLARVIAAKEQLPRGVYRDAVIASATPGESIDDYLTQKAVADTSELEPIVDRVLAANAAQVEQYRAGKTGVLGFLVGQVMKETNGRADARVVNELLRQKLEA